MLPRLASNDSAALPSKRLQRLSLGEGTIPHQGMAVTSSDVQWEALELREPRLGAAAMLTRGGLVCELRSNSLGGLPGMPGQGNLLGYRGEIPPGDCHDTGGTLICKMLWELPLGVPRDTWGRFVCELIFGVPQGLS